MKSLFIACVLFGASVGFASGEASAWPPISGGAGSFYRMSESVSGVTMDPKTGREIRDGAVSVGQSRVDGFTARFVDGDQVFELTYFSGGDVCDDDDSTKLISLNEERFTAGSSQRTLAQDIQEIYRSGYTNSHQENFVETLEPNGSVLMKNQKEGTQTLLSRSAESDGVETWTSVDKSEASLEVNGRATKYELRTTTKDAFSPLSTAEAGRQWPAKLSAFADSFMKQNSATLQAERALHACESAVSSDCSAQKAMASASNAAREKLWHSFKIADRDRLLSACQSDDSGASTSGSDGASGGSSSSGGVLNCQTYGQCTNMGGCICCNGGDFAPYAGVCN